MFEAKTTLDITGQHFNCTKAVWTVCSKSRDLASGQSWYRAGALRGLYYVYTCHYLCSYHDCLFHFLQNLCTATHLEELSRKTLLHVAGCWCWHPYRGTKKQYRYSSYNMTSCNYKIINQGFISEWCHQFLLKVQLFGSQEIQDRCKSCRISINKYLQVEGQNVMMKM